MMSRTVAENLRRGSISLGQWACAAIIAGTCFGCTDQSPPSSIAPESEAESSRAIAQALHSDGVLLDMQTSQRGTTHTIAGALEPVRVGTDALRTIVLTEVPDDLAFLEGRRVLDAQFTADGAVLLGADRVLRHYSAGQRTDGHTQELASGVLGPISTAAGRVAYVYGEPPDLRLGVVDLDEKVARALAPELTTVWSPALSPDGREVIVAASVKGRPRLFRVDADQKVHALPFFGAIPSSPVAPIWRDDHLIFEADDLGVVQLDLVTNEIEGHAAGATLLPDDTGGQVRIVVDGQVQPLDVVNGGER